MTEPRRIFVFGSNLAGIHGAGSALHARKHHGAAYGQGVGFWGNSYAIPTKDRRLRVLPLHDIAAYVASFLCSAQSHPDMQFDVVAIGCGLAGYTPEHIAPMFRHASANVNLPPEFRAVLENAT